MEQEKVLEVFVQIRKAYNLLGEIMDLSRQMGESLDRDDQTVFQMLLSMRRDPIEELAYTKERTKELLQEDFSPEDGAHLRAVLNGGPAEDPLLQKMAEQMESNNRLWEQVISLDRRLSEKVAHEQSIYAKDQ